MAYRITATTDADRELLDRIRELAWKSRQPVSEVIRQAFQVSLDLEDIDSGKRR